MAGSRPFGRPDLLSPELMAALAERLGWVAGDEVLLTEALSHRSWCAETPGSPSNERLEFLGDSVLGLVVTDHLFRTYPAMSEGELAKVRASVVSSAALAEIASELNLGEAILLGKGEDSSQGRFKPSILADALEAIIGAAYLDGGWDTAQRLVMSILDGRIELAATGPGGQDYKTRLQELCARGFDALPVYRVVDQGPDHAKEFSASVAVAGVVRGTGRGRSKKQAEQAAARVAWENLVEESAMAGLPASQVSAPPANPEG
ncbi:MAG: ribonuclease III [Acidimicrobiales bacterium]